MKHGYVKRLLATVLTAAMVLNMATEPALVVAASKTVTVSTQKQLNKALKNKNTSTVAIKSTAKKTFKAKADKCNAKILKVKTENATIKNYTRFKQVKISGKKNVFYEYAGNADVVFGGSNSKLIAGNKTTVGTVTQTGTNNFIKVNKGTTIKELCLNETNAKTDVVVNGTLNSLQIKEKSILSITGTTNGLNLTCQAQDSKITSSVPLTATINKNGILELKEGAENTVLKTEGEAVIVVTNNTKKNITIETPNGDVAVEPGKTINSDEKKDTGDNGNGVTGGNGQVVNTVTGISLDTTSMTLSGDEEATKEVSITTYNQFNESYSAIKNNSDVEVSLVSADLLGPAVSKEDVKANPDRFYTINKEKVTFLSKNLDAGEYVYQIKVGDYTKTVTVTVTVANVLSSISLDATYVTLSNETKETREVSITTYNQYNQSYDYIKSNTDVEVDFISADLSGQTLTKEAVQSNTEGYYTIDHNKVTFLSKELPSGEYVYQIKVGNSVQSITVNVIGDAQATAEKVLLPYLGDNAASPCSNATVDAVVTDEENANKTVSYAFYSKLGDCDPVLIEKITDLSDYEYEIYQSGTLYEEKTSAEAPLELSVSSLDESSRFVNKLKEGTYTTLVTVMEGDKQVTYSNKLKVVDTQPQPVLEQYKNTVSSNLDKEFIDTDKTLNKYIMEEYNTNIAKNDGDRLTSTSDLTYNLEPNLSRACNSFYLKYGLYQSIKVTMDGITYNMSDPRIKLIGLTSAETTMSSNTLRDNTTNLLKNYIRSASMKDLTVYLDVARWKENGKLPIYIPYTFEDANIAFTYSDDTTVELQYKVANKAPDYKKLVKSNTYLAVDDNGAYLYLKITDADGIEIKNYSGYSVKSLNPEIVKAESSINAASKSVALTPVSEGTAEVVICDATTKDELKTIIIKVGDCDPSEYAVQLDKNEITLSNNSEVIDKEAVSVNLVNPKTNEAVPDYAPYVGSKLFDFKLLSGVKVSGVALSEDDIVTIQNVIDNDLTTSESEAKVVYRDGTKLILKGYTQNTLSAGTYVFEVSLSGMTTTLTVHIEDVNLEGEVSYAFVTDPFNFDLDELVAQNVVKDPYVIKVVKQVNGKGVSYVTGAAITFSDSRLDNYYDKDTNILEVFKTNKVNEDEYSELYNLTDLIPTTDSTFKATFTDENEEEQNLIGTIHITNSNPFGVVPKQTDIDTASLADNYYRIIWNLDAALKETYGESYETYLSGQKELLAQYIYKKYCLVSKLTNASGYALGDFDYEYQYDTETGRITGILITRVEITTAGTEWKEIDGKNIGINYPQTYELNTNILYTFK